ncbi:MAG: FAD-binding protein [Coriobacteriia bacterium]|nr:FAD-binding protein [Coriobacteriia bacterium]
MAQLSMDRRSFVAGSAAVGIAGAVAASGLVGATRAEAEEAHKAAVTSYYQCAEDWLGLPPETGEPSETYECDVLVLGGGHAGIHAALAAAEGGAKVIVVEKWAEDMRKVKGEDIGHINSQWLIDQGYGPYDVGEVTNEFVRRAGGRCNPEIIRKFVANSGEMFDHLQSLVSWPDDRIKIMPTTERNPEASPFDPSQVICQVSGSTADGPVEYPMMCGGNGSYAAVAQFMGEISHDNSIPGCAAMSRLDEVMQFAILKGQELGAEWHYGERALKLTTDESGAVTGAISQKNDDETYVEYKAKTGVILCLGDYSGDYKMVWNLNADIAEFNARQGLTQDDLFSPFADCTGDGQKMACWIGAVMEPTPRASMNTGGGGGGPWGTCPYLFLNANGERFCNEANAVGVTEATLLQPAGVVATVTDAKYYETLKNAGLDHGAPNYGRPVYYEELVADTEAIELENPEGGPVRKCIIAERDPSTVYASETLEGALKLAGYEGEALETALAQVAAYNELCASGKDSQYGKDAKYMVPIDEPPFYTAPADNSKTTSAGLVTLAGLETNNNLQVLDVSGNVIPGLWAAGNCLGERYGNSYATPFAGNSIGMAMTHGRVAGKLITGQEVL